MELENAILITGAGQRLGEFVARKLLAQGKFPVVISYRTKHPAVAELESLGAHAIQADFCEVGAVDNLIDQVNQKVKSLRAILHNASLWLDDQVENSLQQQFLVHVEAPFKLTEGLAAKLLASDCEQKDIITFCDAALEFGNSNQIGYFATKAALQNMMKSWAKKYAPQIKSNDIAPGLLKFNSWDDEEYRAKRLQESLISVEPGFDTVWQAIEFIFNNRYATGSVITLDGGRKLKGK